MLMSTVFLAGCVILKDGKILLIQKEGRDFWELPGGVIDEKSEEEKKAAEKTELQIGISPTIVQHFTILEYQKEGTNIEATIFECNIDPDAELSPGENVEDVRWFDITELSKENIGNDVKEILEGL